MRENVSHIKHSGTYQKNVRGSLVRYVPGTGTARARYFTGRSIVFVWVRIRTGYEGRRF
jgi:hypothetical protein